MSPRRTLTVADFRRMARDLGSTDNWRAVPPFDTPLGRFNVRLSQPPDTEYALDSRQTPDAEVVATANTLADFLIKNANAVLAAVHENYLAACWDEGWMDGCEVPIGLTVTSMCEYLTDPTIAVDRAGNGAVSGVFYFSPQWDPEHGLYLKVEDGRVVRTEP